MGPAQTTVPPAAGSAPTPGLMRPRGGGPGSRAEMVNTNAKPSEIQIRNSNTLMLVTLLRKLGADATDLGFVRDEPPLIRQAILRGKSFEALFVTGGMSMGEFDYVPKILQEMGVDLKITKL